MECRTVIFDMGGVLLNFDFDVYLNSFREIGLKEIDQMADRYRQKGPFFEIEAGLIDEKEFFDQIRARLPKPHSDKEIAKTWCRFLTGLKPESLAAVEEIHRRKPTYLLSNSNPIHWNWVCSRYFPTEEVFRRYFDGRFLSFEMKKSKPDPEIYEEVERQLKLNPHDILFIDDSEENCRQAEKAGWQTMCPASTKEWIDFLKTIK